jgi:hypothetical protein
MGQADPAPGMTLADIGKREMANGDRGLTGIG